VLPEAEEHIKIVGALERIQPDGKIVKGAELRGRQFVLLGQAVRREEPERKGDPILPGVLRGGEVVEAGQERPEAGGQGASDLRDCQVEQEHGQVY
jgi:hypothetical protein